MELIVRMVEHHVWLIEQLVDRAGRLTDEQLDAPIDGIDGGSLRWLLSRLIGQMGMWNAAMSDREYDFGCETDEAATLVGVTGRLLTAITAVTGCDRVYQWATMGGYPHFHLWLVPWWDAGGPRGPRYLVAAIGDAAGCPPDTADRTARRLRTALTHADPAPAR